MLSPNSFELHNLLGILYHQTGQLEKAIKHYQISKKINPKCSANYFNIGKALEYLGQFKDAAQVYREFLQNNFKESPIFSFFEQLESDYPVLTKQFNDIDGFLFPIEGYTLRIFAAYGDGEGEIVEIGSYKGKSTCWLASGSKEAGREIVTAVDHFKGSPEHQMGFHNAQISSTLPEFNENIKRLGLEDKIRITVSDSVMAISSWSQPIRLLFIDGDHSYEASKLDFECWSPFIVQKGYVIFHDVDVWSGVTKFYNELIHSTNEFMEILSIMSLRVIQKTKRDH
jgi:predicted O-methyltransferase YrrM